MPFFVSLTSSWQHWQYRLLVLAWLLCQVSFWAWWLQSDHVVTPFGMCVNSLLLLWTAFLPAWFLFFLGRVRRPNPDQPLPEGGVAMIVTKAPSEPWPIVSRTLEAMLAQDFPRPYDAWLADEDPTPETRDWCAAHGVHLSCRKGVVGYHNPTWPRRQKCKEGNLAYFYEVMGGYDNYAFVSQLDADHVPAPHYLTEMIRPFANPAVGYVAAPSVCDANAAQSWAARGRLYAEAAWHGSTQAGFNGGFAPTCIGSHYAVRTVALKQIGGIGPELAEDFSTTLAMNSGGWQGAFAIDAEAHGDGPATFADAIVQEFQWSRSITNVFLSMWSKQARTLPLRARIQLGFPLIWYVVFPLHVVVGNLLPIIALLWGTPWVDVDFFEFVLRSSLPTFTLLLIAAWVRRRGWLRPSTAPVVSWEAMLFDLARWPWVLLGIGHAVVGQVLHQTFSFRVTPKGATGPQLLQGRVLLPYVLVVLADATAALLIPHADEVGGYVYLVLLAAVAYTVVTVSIAILHIRENKLSFGMPRAARVRSFLRVSPALLVAVGFSSAALTVHGEPALADALGRSSMRGTAVLPLPVLPDGVVPIDPGAPVESWPTIDINSDTVAPTAPPLPTQLPQALPLPGDRLAVGAYDPGSAFANTNLDLEQRYVSQSDPAAFGQALDELQNRRTALITLEPWPAAGSTDPTGLKDVVDGNADANLLAIAAIAATHHPQTILLRWGHEMELSDVYPWGAQSPELYIAAYRHVHAIFDTAGASNVRFVWSPAGNDNAAQYFPGTDVVDYVGVTVLEDASWDAGFGLPPQSFDQILGPRYTRLAPFGKPIIVTELGVSGSSQRQTSWLDNARSSFASYPQLRGVLYFEAPNPPVNHLPTQPDWRLSPDARVAFQAQWVAPATGSLLG